MIAVRPLVLVALLVAPLAAEAQPAERVYRIAYLGNSSAALEAELVSAFRDGLRDLNYVESRNVVIHYDMPTTHRSARLVCALCAFAATATSGQGSTGGALPPPKNARRHHREDNLKADQA